MFAIGDVQGCYLSLKALLRKIPVSEPLMFCGDLINRGPSSLDTLELLKDLGPRARFVLGNHDLHFLATAIGSRKPSKSDTLKGLLDSPHLGSHIDWLRQQSLAWSAKLEIKAEGTWRQRTHLFVHAGLLPAWSAIGTVRLGEEVSGKLQGDDWQELIRTMYGNEPSQWSESLSGPDRDRLIINTLTRCRFLYANGALELSVKEGLSQALEGTMPWFDHPLRRTAGDVVVFGHWSQLGLVLRQNLVSLDTGCVWGGKLTAVELETRRVIQVDYQD